MRVDTLSVARYKRAVSGEIEHLRNNIEIGNERSDMIAMEQLEEDYYNVIGYGDKFHRLHQLKNKKALLEADLIIHDKRFNINLIRIVNSEIKNLENSMSKGFSIDGMKAILDKYYGYSLDLEKETVLSFHEKIKAYERA